MMLKSLSTCMYSQNVYCEETKWRTTFFLLRLTKLIGASVRGKDEEREKQMILFDLEDTELVLQSVIQSYFYLYNPIIKKLSNTFIIQVIHTLNYHIGLFFFSCNTCQISNTSYSYDYFYYIL